MRDASSPATGLLDPRSSFYRWSIMVAAGLMLFGSYFAFDSISAISQLLIEQEGYTATQVGWMESLYSWPSILGAALLAGILVDKFGPRVMSLVCSGIVVLGAVSVAMAPGLAGILVGRAMLGAGAEALVICQSVILSKWFADKELALAFGLAVVFVRLGSFASHNLETALAQRYGGVSAALWFAALMCVCSLVFALYYVVMDTAAEGRGGPQKESGAQAGGDESDAGLEAKTLRERIRSFDRRYWYILVLVTAFYGAIFPFRSLAQDFFHAKWGIAPENGAHIVSILIFFSMVLTPAAGWVVDKLGKRVTLTLIGTALLVPAHLSLGLWDLHPVYPMVLLGISLSLVAAAIWPSVPLVVEREAVGTAYGLIFVVQNLGLACFPVLNGALRDATQGYAWSQLMFAGLGLVGLVFAMLLMRADRSAGHTLERETKRDKNRR